MSETMDIQASNLETLNNLYLMQSLLTNMETNIYLIEQGARGQIITVNNANLFQLAAQYYGDATRWTAIAQANGLTDPVIQATINLNITPPSTQLIISGFVQIGQTINIILDSVLYSYVVLITDTIETIATNIANLIPGALSNNNIVVLPTYSTISTSVSMFITLVIPQTAADQGGVLQS